MNELSAPQGTCAECGAPVVTGLLSCWALATDRPNTIGRAALSSVPPDADLWPDRRALDDGPAFLSSTFSGRH
ncbi:MAG TPA: hypothetical protein VFH48_14455 [Chloroflexota bacterium]|nr:hypothetical protein [Chloroflexota bacterium]